MQRSYVANLSQNINHEVTIKGWIDIRRDQGKLIFLDFRDVTGKVQDIVLPNNSAVLEMASTVRQEWVVEVKGKVSPRPERNIKPDKQNGNIEIEVLQIIFLNQAETPAFDVSLDDKDPTMESPSEVPPEQLKELGLIKTN